MEQGNRTERLNRYPKAVLVEFLCTQFLLGDYSFSALDRIKRNLDFAALMARSKEICDEMRRVSAEGSFAARIRFLELMNESGRLDKKINKLLNLEAPCKEPE